MRGTRLSTRLEFGERRVAERTAGHHATQLFAIDCRLVRAVERAAGLLATIETVTTRLHSRISAARESDARMVVKGFEKLAKHSECNEDVV